MSKISVSILSANTMRLEEEAQKVKEAGCDSIHFDVMDGVFVPNISFGPKLLSDMRGEFDFYFDVHLMLKDALKYVDVFAKSGADAITVHVESENFKEALKHIKELGLKVGASLNPATPASALQDVLQDLDLILVMTVQPGFGGQKLKQEVIQKISDFREMGFEGEIEVDGGINVNNAPLLVEVGADTLVMGTSFFDAEDAEGLVKAVDAMKR